MFQMEQFPVKHNLSPWYVTGFCEGEASFTYSRSGKVLMLYFAIKLSASDLPILQRIRSFFGGGGRIYAVHSRQGNARRPDTRAVSYFRVTKAVDLVPIVDHFDRYPLAGSKAQSFATWREMVGLKQRFRKPPVERLETLARELSASIGLPRSMGSSGEPAS
jgi:hypothetical protein